MRTLLLLAAAAAIASASSAAPTNARQISAPVRESVHPISRDRMPNGEDLIAVEVRFPPGASSVPHRHPAFVYAFVLAGSIVSAVGNERPRTYRAGQSWHEPAGALHRVTRNASSREPAKLLAIFVARGGETALVQPVSGIR